MENIDKAHFVLIAKKYLSRYVLPYEVLPLELCYSINDKCIFNENILHDLLLNNAISENEVVLKLNAPSCDAPFISLSNLKSIYFATENSYQKFQDRSYENYDIGEFHCSILQSEPDSNSISIKIAEPIIIDKTTFSTKMALSDAIMRMAHEFCMEEGDLSFNKLQIEDIDNLIIQLYGFDDVDDFEKMIISTFFRTCAHFNLEAGWSLKEVIELFQSQIPSSLKNDTRISKWVETVEKLINNEYINLNLTDQGSIVFRAMTLAFMNPEIYQLDAIKRKMGNEIGDMVLKLAKKFVIARSGYSYLTVENRKKIGKSRFQLQELNAEINNKAVVSNKNTVQIPSNTFVNDIPHHSWINKDSLLKQYINDDVIIAIDGIKPMSGFCLNLIYNKNNKLALRVIDLHGPKGKKKLTGKLYANLINVQKHLPAYSRFEINEDGLFLTLPNEWLQLESIKDNLISLFATIKPLGFEQKSSKFIFYK